MLPILRSGNTDGGFSLISAPFLLGLLSAALQTAALQTSPSASDIDYEIVLPVASLPSLDSPRGTTLNWQDEWVRRFSPRVVVVQNGGWKHRTLPRNDDDTGDAHQRIVLHKKWSALEPSIRFL
ncbi:hypothetical protein niasHS_006188 [Heterodera schachtii]|uniref:Uncharacterized protein n=1 Tax=Heterodera schachtii TaxID=97005 RepID=A0ABD2JT03_HETSC